MTTVTIHEAKTNLSKLIERAEAGEDVVIARGNRPVARLVKLDWTRKTSRLPPGLLKGYPETPDSFFFDDLPEDELRLFEGEE
jgi:prevent-host-death family protein